MAANQDIDYITQATLKTIDRFNQAVNEHDLDLTMSLMTDDCIFENTFPAPDGERFEGQVRVRAFWKEFFESSPDANFKFEEIFASGERAVARWYYQWKDADGIAGHIRGVDVFKVKLGKVAEKLSYVKG